MSTPQSLQLQAGAQWVCSTATQGALLSAPSPQDCVLGSSRCWQHHHTPGTCSLQGSGYELQAVLTGLFVQPQCQTGTAKGSLSFPLLVGWILKSWAGQGTLTGGLSRSQPESCWHSWREHRHWWVGGSSLNRNCSQTVPIINHSLRPFQYCTDCWEKSLAALTALPGLPSGMTAPL